MPKPWRSDSPLKYYWEGKTPPLVEPLPGSFSGGENHSVTAEGLRLHDALPNEPFDAELRAPTIRASLEQDSRSHNGLLAWFPRQTGRLHCRRRALMTCMV